MRSLTGFLFFIGVALFLAPWRWPSDPVFLQSAPQDAVAYAALWTPLFATLAMPTKTSLIVYPLSVVALWFGAGYLGQHVLPEPPPERGYVCGLPFFASMMLGLIGIVFGAGGRALGFIVRGKLSPLSTYLVQVLPFAALVALAMMMRP
jgi:hypothetical protein